MIDIINATTELFKINIINHFKLNDKKRKKIGPIFLILFFFGLFLAFFQYSYMFGTFLKKYNITYLIFPAFIGMGIIMMLMISTYKAKGALFEFKDIDLLFSMPIPESSILAYKIINMMSFNYIIAFLTIAPSAISYFILEQTKSNYLLFTALTILFTPLIPTLLSGLFGYIIGYFSSKSKHKSLIETLSSLCIIFIFISFTLKLKNILYNILQTSTNLDVFVRKIFYPLYLIQSALRDGNAINMAIFILISIFSFLIFVIILNHLFIKINKQMKEKFSKKNFEKINLKTTNPIISLFIKEFSLYTKSSIYMLNTCFGAISMIIFGISTFFFNTNIISSTILNLINVELTNYQILIIICGIMAPLSCTTPACISMEGRSLWICRALPISEMKIFSSKMLVDILIIIPINIISSILLSINFNLSVTQSFTLIMLIISVGTTMTQFGLLLNLKYPKLRFNTQSEAIKESLSASLAVYIPLGIAFLLIWTYTFIKVDFNIYMKYMLLLFLVLNFVCFIALKTYGVKKFKNLYC